MFKLYLQDVRVRWANLGDKEPQGNLVFKEIGEMMVHPELLASQEIQVMMAVMVREDNLEFLEHQIGRAHV